MRLASLRLAGFRRFADETTIDLSPPVVAVVGPNEAGKSSLLNALSRVANEEPFPEGDFSGRERPYDVDDPDEIPMVLSAEFVVENEDRESLAGIPGAEAIRLYRITKWADGSVERSVVPEPERPVGEREAVQADLRRASRNATVRKASENEGNDKEDSESAEVGMQPLIELLASAADDLEGATAPKLKDELLDLLDEIRDRLLSVNLEGPKYAAQLPDRIAALAKLSRDTAPARASKMPYKQLSPLSIY